MMLPPRAGHATVAFGKNLFVFGGFTDSQNLYDDLYMLDVGMYAVIEKNDLHLSNDPFCLKRFPYYDK